MSDDARGPVPPPGLTEAILRATSGPVCPSAEARLCDFVDGRLDPVDRDLVARHLSACAGCAALAGILERMAADLPSLAEMDPGPGFAARVAAATTGAARGLPLGVRIARAADALLQRPRIAFESAYVGACVLMLLFGAPFSPLADVPRKALAVASTNPIVEAREPVARIEQSVTEDIQWAWAATRTSVGARSKEVAGRVAGRSASLLRRLEDRFTAILERLGASGEMEEGSRAAEPPEAAGRHDESRAVDTNARFPQDGSRPEGDKP